VRLRAEVTGSLLVLAIAVFGVVGSSKLRIWSEGEPGEGLFPLLLSLLLGALSAVSLVRSAPASAPVEGLSPNRWKVLAYAIALVTYAGLFVVIGYLLTTLVVFTALLRLAERLSWTRTLAVALGTVIVTYLLFERLLHVPLPRGVLP
jgi:putative tricarboxylic transport membrane protein